MSAPAARRCRYALTPKTRISLPVHAVFICLHLSHSSGAPHTILDHLRGSPYSLGMSSPTHHLVRSPDYPSGTLPTLSNAHKVTPCDAPEGLDPSHATPGVGRLWRAQGVVEDVTKGRTLPPYFAQACLNDLFILAMRQEYGLNVPVTPHLHTGPLEARWQLVRLAENLMEHSVSPQTVRTTVEMCINGESALPKLIQPQSDPDRESCNI